MHWLQDYNVLGAGMYNGQFGVFDLRKGSGMTDVSPIEHSHRWVSCLFARTCPCCRCRAVALPPDA